jgi:non-ribosomal peptide synthetase component E (peptide arylation enzyme)
MTSAPLPTFSPAYRQAFVDQGLWLDRTLSDYFAETVARLPDHVAIVAGDTRLTFAAWAAEVERVAAGLVALGIGHGDIVGVQLPNWAEMCVVQLALARIGAIIQPMHVVYREREMASQLRFCDARAAIVPHTHHGFEHARAVVAMQPDLPLLRHVVTVRGGVPGSVPGTVPYESLGGAPAALAAHEAAHPVHPDDPFYLNFTSGTEGEPKGFLHTHNTMLSVLKRMADGLLASDPTSAADVLLANSPMSHSFGHLTTYHVLLRGIRMVLVERFEPGETLRIVEQERVTALSGTPAHLISLLTHPDFPARGLRCVKSVGVGGAACPPQLAADIERHFGCRIGNTYGMGENIIHTRTLPTDSPEIVRTTVGSPVPWAETRIVAADRTTDMPVGETGEIAFRGPTLFLGYYKRPELTAATRSADGWFFTGDLGFLDADGRLHLVGRKKDEINRGGTKIQPKEVEDLLHAHPAVQRAAVVGMPDYRLGERICAYVELRPGASLTLPLLRDFLVAQHVTKHKMPERLEIVDALPLTPTGKVKKDPLIADVRAKLALEEPTRDIR